MSSPISLTEMPEDPMKHILEYVDFQSILVLRKTCHDLRNFIDDTKLTSYWTNININVYPESIRFDLMTRAFDGYLNKICIVYEKCSEGCLVKKYHRGEEMKRTILENEEFVTVFCKDFNIVLRNQKTVLEDFAIILNSSNSTVEERVLESINKFFKSINHPLQVKSLFMKVDDQNEILAILPYIDPKPLGVIHISERSESDNFVLILDESGQLEQWKQARKLWIDGFQVPYLSQNIQHFSSIFIDIGYVGISIEELILLKEIFLSSSNLTAIEIFIGSHCRAVFGPELIERFGEPHIDPEEKRNRFFRIPGTAQFLRITLEPVKIYFNRIEQSDVPHNAAILN